MSNAVNLMINADLSTSSRKRKAISLTALIDVVFILLMFFMLTSTFIKWNTLTLQTASAGNEITQVAERTQLIIIRENGDFSLLISPRDSDNSGSLGSSSGSNLGNKGEQIFTELGDLLKNIDLNINTVLLPEAQIKVQVIMDTLSRLKVSGVTQVTLGNVFEGKVAG